VLLGVAVGGVAVALETLIGFWLLNHHVPDVVMVYLLGVVATALRFGYIPSLVTSVLSVGAFDYFFVLPYYSFAVSDERYLLTFGIMLLVGVIVSNLADRVRVHAARTEALALERARLAEEAQRAHAEIENTRLRNALLSSVSHDLRTPLAVVQGAATALLDAGSSLGTARQKEFLKTIADEAAYLNRLVSNLLQMTALEAGALRVRKEWHPLEEIVGVSLQRLEELIGTRRVEVQIAPEASLVWADGTLLQQLFVNLVENAARHTANDTPISLTARRVLGGLEVHVDDSGPGVPVGEEEAVFQKFHRATAQAGGMGLGLTICRGIVAAHGGRIWCENRAEGGASFRFVLPIEQEPPAIAALPEAPGEAATPPIA
jgi:two-component system sensor histidine kinase KdpD